MASAFDKLLRFGPASFLFEALLATGVGILLLLGFILARRAWRKRLFERRDACAREIRAQWDVIVNGDVPADTWMNRRLDREIVETILLDRLDTATPGEIAGLHECLRRSGLLDRRIHQARSFGGWRRRRALASLGRTRLPEAIPPLAEALDDRNADTRLAAVRGLGRLALPQAAVPILERLLERKWMAPYIPIQNALLSCCRVRPETLVPWLRRADAETRALLARVLAEIATGSLGEDLLLLAFDEQPEVRASAARSLGEAQQGVALSTLGALAEDEEWFVRLRAVVGLGRLENPSAIPMLVSALCDRNRFVRLRAAMALARLPLELEAIIAQAEATGDRYAVQALVSELERSGRLLEQVDALGGPQHARAEKLLLAVLRCGAHRLLLSALAQHKNWRVRIALARLLARSGEASLIPLLEKLRANTKSGRVRRMAAWVLSRISRGGTQFTETLQPAG